MEEADGGFAPQQRHFVAPASNEARQLKEQRRAMEGAYNEQKCRASVFAINIRFKEREQGIRKNPFTDVTKDTANQR